MALFKVTKQLPFNWFQSVHKAITEAETHSELERLRTCIEEEANDFWTSRANRAGWSLLYAYANLRYHHLTMRLKRNNKITLQQFNK